MIEILGSLVFIGLSVIFIVHSRWVLILYLLYTNERRFIK